MNKPIKTDKYGCPIFKDKKRQVGIMAYRFFANEFGREIMDCIRDTVCEVTDVDGNPVQVALIRTTDTEAANFVADIIGELGTVKVHSRNGWAWYNTITSFMGGSYGVFIEFPKSNGFVDVFNHGTKPYCEIDQSPSTSPLCEILGVPPIKLNECTDEMQQIYDDHERAWHAMTENMTFDNFMDMVEVRNAPLLSIE